MISPPDGSVLSERPALVWGSVSLSADGVGEKVESGVWSAPVFYTLQIDEDSAFGFPYTYFLSDTAFGVPDSVAPSDTTLRLFWRVRAEDDAGNVGPYAAPWSFTYDDQPPEIDSTTLLPDTGLALPETLGVWAYITDGSEVALALLHYRLNGGPWQVDTMEAMGDSTWYRGDLVVPGGDTMYVVEYYLTAEDVASPPNEGRDPETGSYSFSVVGVMERLSGPPATFSVGVPVPNPVRGGGVVMLALPVAMRVRAEIYDATGKRVLEVHRGLLLAGYHRLRLPDGLAAGIYFLRVEAGTHRVTRRFVVLR